MSCVLQFDEVLKALDINFAKLGVTDWHVASDKSRVKGGKETGTRAQFELNLSYSFIILSLVSFWELIMAQNL